MRQGSNGLQGTVRVPVKVSGTGLHTGRKSTITIEAEAPNHGIVFHVAGRAGTTVEIPANWSNVRRSPLCTCLSSGHGTEVRTVEHLLAACYACGVDNAKIVVSGPEIPLLDGSAKPFVDAMEDTGITRQSAKRRTIRLTKSLDVADGPRWVKVEPHGNFCVALQTYFKPFGRLPWWEREISREDFASEIAPARTFGLLAEGLAAKLTSWFLRDPICLGANARNTVSVWRGRVVTPGGLRFSDEFSRHRALDWVGDLMLAGADIQAKFTCFSPTHHLARTTLEAIFSDPTSYEVVEP